MAGAAIQPAVAKSGGCDDATVWENQTSNMADTENMTSVPGEEGQTSPGPQASDLEPSVMAENSYGLTEEEMALATIQDDPAGGALGSLEETDNEASYGDASSAEQQFVDEDGRPELNLPTTESRYAYVVLAAKRAKQIRDGGRAFVQISSPNVLTTAMQEITNKKIGYRLAEEDGKPADD